MTTDIMERLRAGGDAMVRIDGPLKREAADEIERLRGALDTSRELRSLVNGELAVARAEIARLREEIEDMKLEMKDIESR